MLTKMLQPGAVRMQIAWAKWCRCKVEEQGALVRFSAEKRRRVKVYVKNKKGGRRAYAERTNGKVCQATVQRWIKNFHLSISNRASRPRRSLWDNERKMGNLAGNKKASGIQAQ